MKNRNSLKKCVLDHRLSALVVTALAGMLCVYVATRHSDFLLMLLDLELALSDTEKTSGTAERFLASFYVIVLGLPTLAMLWFFRTHDTREQIKKTEESTNANIFVNAQNMLADSNKVKKANGLILLMTLRRKGLYQSMIDSLTQNVNLGYVDLSCASLNGANLHSANLTGANLQKANLQDADMQCASLSGCDLRGAKLQGANLEGTKDTITMCAKLGGAEHYDTHFPKEFNPEMHGMQKVEK